MTPMSRVVIKELLQFIRVACLQEEISFGSVEFKKQVQGAKAAVDWKPEEDGEVTRIVRTIRSSEGPVLPAEEALRVAEVPPEPLEVWERQAIVEFLTFIEVTKRLPDQFWVARYKSTAFREKMGAVECALRWTPEEQKEVEELTKVFPKGFGATKERATKNFNAWLKIATSIALVTTVGATIGFVHHRRRKKQKKSAKE